MEPDGPSPADGLPGEPAAGPRLSYVVGRLSRTLGGRIDEAVRPLGLTGHQYAVLSVLRVDPSLSNAQLARRSFTTPQSANEMIHALEQKGFVERTPDPNHGRIIRIRITPEAECVLVACDAALDAIEVEMLRELSCVDRERFLADLRSCVRSLGVGLLQSSGQEARRTLRPGPAAASRER